LTIENVITLVAAILAFFASVVATAVSIYNTRFKRFLMERWWDRKAEAYIRIIEALSSLVHYYNEHYDAELEHKGIPESRQKDISEDWNRGYIELKRATAIGSFLISIEAEAALAKMWKERGKGVHPDDWFRLLESDYVKAEECLKSIVIAAKADLGVR
jgi:hypothetical protein